MLQSEPLPTLLLPAWVPRSRAEAGSLTEHVDLVTGKGLVGDYLASVLVPLGPSGVFWGL